MQRSRAMRIVLVEDNLDDVEVTTRVLRSTGMPHDLEIVYDGQAVLDLLFPGGRDDPAFVPDLVLLDLNLPRVNSFEVLQRIRACAWLATVPVVILTASVREEDVRRRYRLGANTYVQKPANLRKAIDALGQHWGLFAMLPPVA